MIKALLIGCGNIGAMYDLDSDEVLTWAKAFHLDSDVIFDVYDRDENSVKKIADHYGVCYLRSLPSDIYRKYQMVVIATPTSTHYGYLSELLRSGPELLICEKPIDSDGNHLRKLEHLYRKSNRRVMVNFHRRYQPKLLGLRATIADMQCTERCTNIVVTYQRGFHNNASHAVDLLELLLDGVIDFSASKVCYSECDEFGSDPTMSLVCQWDGINLHFNGLPYIKASYFEIAIIFQTKAIFLREGCDEIEYSSTHGANKGFYPRFDLVHRETGVMKNYMSNVLSHAKRMLEDPAEPDNFLQSLNISKRIIKLQKAN